MKGFYPFSAIEVSEERVENDSQNVYDSVFFL